MPSRSLCRTAVSIVNANWSPDADAVEPVGGDDHKIAVPTADSEEFHLDDLALLDGAPIGGDFDVAVGLGQTRDVARAFERRVGGPVMNAHGIELVPAGGGRDSPCERDTHEARLVER